MLTYSKFFSKEFKKYCLEEMSETIGYLDYEVIDGKYFEVLFYLFPLIEKIIIDILKYSAYSNIELYNQGTYRTLKSIIEKDENQRYFDHELMELLLYYYGEDGLRNELFHYHGKRIDLTYYDILAVKCIALKLLKQYKATIEETRDYEDLEIELL